MTMVAGHQSTGEVPERWSAKAKTEVVLRLLRGEAIDAVSREVQVPAHELESWRRVLGPERHVPTDRVTAHASTVIGSF